jgi:uncharacterized protein (TIGR02466 family)
MKDVDFDIAPLFPTPVGIYKLRNFKNTYVDVNNYDKELFYENPHQNNTVNTKSNNILLDPKFKDLKDIVDALMEHYLYGTLCFPQTAKMKLVCSWMAIGFPGSYTNSHLHTNSLYSGILYLDSEETSGNLEFAKSFSTQTHSSNAVRPVPLVPNILNSDTWSIAPKSGEVFIFPSHLEHSVSTNTSQKNRCVLSFNYFLTGVISEDSTKGLVL